MKLLFLLFFGVSVFYSQEIQRVEEIIGDITKLRGMHEKCKKKIDENDALREKNKALQKKIVQLEKIVKKQKNLLKTKENDDKNRIFPKLLMKEKMQKSQKERPETFQAAAFELKYDSAIYDSLNGNEIDKWEKGTSFTSNKRTQEWIKITGYFVQKKWRPAKKEMWIKRARIIKKSKMKK